MESLEFNKVAGGVLGTLLFVVGLGIVTDGMFSPEKPKKPGWDLPSAPEGGGEAKAESKEKEEPLPNLLASADAGKGKSDVGVCGTCHNFEKGAGPKIGPPLYGVVGRDKGSVAGFPYSDGMKAKGGTWTFDDLNAFLTKPAAYVQGTKMNFGGESDPKKRAEIIAYLDKNSDSPVPLPKPVAAAKSDKPEPTKSSEPAGGEKAGKTSDTKTAAAGDPVKGKADTAVCGVCHNFEKGAGAKVGPDLHGVVGRDKGSVPGFNYSAAMKAKGGKWTPEDLGTFITNPQAYVKGTLMGYAGEPSEKKRADIVAYLSTLSDHGAAPAPQKAAAAAPAAGAKPADAPKSAAAQPPKAAEVAPAKSAAPTPAQPPKAAEAAPAKPSEAAKPAPTQTAAADGARGDAAKGKADAAICGVCHNFEKGAGPKVGPALYGVVGRDKGSVAGFNYSPAMKAKGGKWTAEDVGTFIANPQTFVKGTLMAYPGEPDPKKRADIVAYLSGLSDNPSK